MCGRMGGLVGLWGRRWFVEGEWGAGGEVCIGGADVEPAVVGRLVARALALVLDLGGVPALAAHGCLAQAVRYTV